MASAVAAPKPVDESLWWDSFVALLDELDKVPPSEDLPDHLAEKLRRNHAWFLNSVTRFKPPHQTSRHALDSLEIVVGLHRLVVKPEFKKAALRVSGFLCLNEVQSYILVHRSSRISKLVDVEDKEFLHSILLHYFLERQCLLQCVRQIFGNALNTSDGFLSNEAFKGIASQLVHDGLEQRLLSVFQEQLLSVLPDQTEVDFKILWVDETLIEGNLLMDILFLAYYDNFCSCNSEQWKTICSLFKDVLCGSLNVGKVAVSIEAKNSFAHVKAKMLLILIETLDLENLLHMVHDDIPFREGSSIFSVADIKEMDSLVSKISDLGAVESGPLLLAWAVFLCLVLSLPETRNSITLMEIDHISYVRQAFEVAAFDYLLEILCNDTFRDSDGPVSGFLSVIRTFLSAFIASYELSHQKEDNTLIKILDILYHIYHGEESLAMQFWDKDSFVDGPIRSMLFMLEKEYPVHVAGFVRLLSALCEGPWPAECVYNYLDKMSGITTLFEIPGGYGGKSVSDIIETHHPVEVPGVEGLIVPGGKCGQILKVLAPNVAFVHWECAHSGILLLVLRLTQEIHSDNTEDVLYTLNLLYRMISFNKALGFALMSVDKSLPIRASRNSMQLEMSMRVDVVKIICNLIFKSVQDVSNARILSISLDILTEMLKCAPSHVIKAVVESNIFGVNTNETSSGAWIFSGGLARMLMVDLGENDDSYALAASVIDFTVQLVEKGADDNLVSALIVFSLQYVFVNHMHWKYKSKHSRWKLTLKVFEVMKSCIKASRVSQKLCSIIWDILLYDSSIHNILCRTMCISAEALRSYISRHYEFKETEYLQQAICSAFDVLCSIMADISQEISSNTSAFVQTMLSPSVKPLPVVQAAVSLISFSENSAIQVAAARALSFFCFIASRLQSYTVENVSLVVEAVQIKKLQTAIFCILNKQVKVDEDLTIAIFDLLNAVAHYQPALLSSLILSEEKVELSSDVASDSANQPAAVPVVENWSSNKASPIEAILKYVEDSEILLDSAPQLLLSILNFLKALWEAGIQFTNILEKIRSNKKFWEWLSSFISPTHVKNGLSVKDLSSQKIQCSSLRYRCQGNVLEIMAYELFFQEKVLQCEIPDKQTCTIMVNGTSVHTNVLYAQEILSTWFDSPFLENLIKSYSDIGYDKEVIFHAKVAICVCIVHLTAKLATGNAGSLSLSLVKKIHEIYNKLKAHPAFSVLLSQYSLRGYSEEKELTSLIISDLYYHLQGKLEGREITSGPFQELLHFLLSLGTFECNDEKYERKLFLAHENVSMFDIKKVQEEIGAELWDHSDWNTSKEVAERMFMHMHSANLSSAIANSKHFALKALVSVVSVYKGNMKNTKESMLHGRYISEPAVESGIRYLCNCLQYVADMLVQEPNPPEGFLRVFTTRQELLLILSMILFKHYSHRTNKRQFIPLSILITKSSGSIIKVCAALRPLTPVLSRAVKLMLTLLLTSLEFSNHMVHAKDKSDFEVKLLADASLISIGLLPVLCKYTEDSEYSNLSVASMDVIIKALTPDAWLPILRKHLPLQLILQNIQEKDALASGPVIFNFLLTLGHTKGGAEMLSSGKFFSPITVLLSQLCDDRPFSSNLDKSDITTIDDEKHVHNWVLSLAIVISVIQSLGDDTSCMDIMVSALRYFFSEKPYMISFYFSALNHLADDHSKKRAQAHNFQISLTALKLTEHILMLLCVLVRYQASWIKGMKEMDSELRETIIHLLAFISRGGQRIGDSPISPNRSLTLFCQPTTKEEFELNRRPSFIKSRHGWFSFSTAGFLAKARSSDSSNTTLSGVIRDKANDNADFDHQSHFSDTIAVHMYRIVFLLLKFLCMQAKAAAKRADEVEFVDLAYFPELPTPEILHGLQDQAIAIVTELCEANRPNSIEPETESVCSLLLQILEKSLYLELCVSQTCGIRPVLGRVEDFSKEINGLMDVVEQHTNFKEALRSLRQIIVLLYPGLLQTTKFI